MNWPTIKVMIRNRECVYERERVRDREIWSQQPVNQLSAQTRSTKSETELKSNQEQKRQNVIWFWFVQKMSRKCCVRRQLFLVHYQGFLRDAVDAKSQCFLIEGTMVRFPKNLRNFKTNKCTFGEGHCEIEILTSNSPQGKTLEKNGFIMS